MIALFWYDTQGTVLAKLVATLILCSAQLAQSQDVEVATERGPYFVGQGVILQLTAKDFEEAPQPTSELLSEVPDGVTVRLRSVSPRVSSSVTIINGSVRRSKEVAFVFRYEVVASRVGKFQVGPFEVKQGGITIQTESVTYQFQEVDQDDDMLIRVNIPDQTFYVGQRVPVEVQWGYAADVRSVSELTIRGELFNQFTWQDQPAARNQQTLTFMTADGEVRLPYAVTKETIGGKEYVVATVRRTLIADQPGEYNLQPVSANIQKVTGWKRDFFDGLIPAKTAPMQASGKPLSIRIKALPILGQPASFAGAVGTGFRLDVDVQGSTIVRQGDPIKLKVTLQGDGNLNEASLPPLSADDGLDPNRFRLPADDVPGKVTGNQKEFEVTIRVEDATVDQVPPIAYSWFDPEQERYVTTRSEPTSLTVREAQVISSSDVVSSQPIDTTRNQQPAEIPRERNASQGATQGADLAIELNPTRLINNGSSQMLALVATSVCYLGGLGALAFTILDQRRRQVPSDVHERRERFKQLKRQIETAAARPAPAAAKEMADVLRSMQPDVWEADRSELSELMRRLDDIAYDPRSNSGPLEAKLVARVIDFVNQTQKKHS